MSFEGYTPFNRLASVNKMSFNLTERTISSNHGYQDLAGAQTHKTHLNSVRRQRTQLRDFLRGDAAAAQRQLDDGEGVLSWWRERARAEHAHEGAVAEDVRADDFDALQVREHRRSVGVDRQRVFGAERKRVEDRVGDRVREELGERQGTQSRQVWEEVQELNAAEGYVAEGQAVQCAVRALDESGDGLQRESVAVDVQGREGGRSEFWGDGKGRQCASIPPGVHDGDVSDAGGAMEIGELLPACDLYQDQRFELPDGKDVHICVGYRL
ncbi:hypothetical protein B0H17DRAFT_1134080 [Mycena rosella]|uniref:Uncharacterized protein n=1 Tax=Mycena rosella TaxID=1033263 RepID=A0AAD7DGG3_MYCRO|nr:hypothetical protein B0H17DRAFT_1134080 [Mycena rosella]